jgi:hypothetical protein
LERCRSLALLALLVVGSLACGARGSAPVTDAAVPELRISLADPALAKPTAPKKDRAGAVGTLRHDAAEAPAEIDLSRWLGADSAEARSEIVVSLKKKSRVLGLRRFALRRPSALGFQDGLLLLEHMRREGVVAPRIRFARVWLDGASLGLMAIEEGQSKEMLESQQRREGVLLRFRGEDLPVARIAAFQANRVLESEALRTELATANGLLQAFLRGDLPASAALDVELTARFVAVALLWDAAEMLRAEELRFYFNPVTQRLEPVAIDAGARIAAGPRSDGIAATGWAARLLEDPELRDTIARESKRIGYEQGAASPPDWLAAEEGRVLAILRGAGFERGETRFDPWRRRAAQLARFDPASPERGAIRLRLAPDPEVPSRRANPVPSATLEVALERHAFLSWDAASRMLSAARGDWKVAGSLVLPDGVGLAIGPGTTLRFAADALLVASGPLRFHGSAEEPVILRGIETPTGAGRWQGLVVLRSGEPLDWEHVAISGTRGIDHEGWRLTGGVTVRAAEARIADSRFEGTSAEDAVNLIRSRFAFRGVSIRNAVSDAFDCDFCEGSVLGGRIERAGGDGIDVSGSVVRIDGAELEDVNDKAISVGEGSRVEARNLTIRRVGTAVVGKDGSTVIFEDSTVSDVQHVAIMAYTKKREYGPGVVTARNIEMVRVGRAAAAQHGSRVLIDGVATATDDIDVDGLYKRGYMKK